MFSKYLSAVLVVLILSGLGIRLAAAQEAVQTRAESIKRDVARLSKDGKKIEIKLNDGTKLKGPVTQVLDDSFEITDTKTKRLSTIAYRDVSSAKKPGWPTGAKIGLGAAIGAVAVIAVIAAIVGAKGLGDFCPLGCAP